MTKHRAWRQKIRDWARGAVNKIAYKYKAIHTQSRQMAQKRPWWRKDLKELLSDLNQWRSQDAGGISLETILDIAQWSTRFRLIVLGTAFLGVLIVGTLFLCADMSNEARLQAHERQILEARYLNYAEQADLMPVYQKQTEIILERFGALLDAIPASLESVHVLSQLNKAAKESGLHLEFFKPLAEEAHAYYIVLPVEIRLRGDYNAIARFLELVSKMQHLVTVDVVMLPSATHQNEVVLASLLKAYRYKNLPTKPEKKAADATP